MHLYLFIYFFVKYGDIEMILYYYILHMTAY